MCPQQRFLFAVPTHTPQSATTRLANSQNHLPTSPTMDFFSQFDSFFPNLDSMAHSSASTPDPSFITTSGMGSEMSDLPVDQDRSGGGQLFGLCVIS